MKPASTALKAILYNYGQHRLADLYTFEFRDSIRRWTSHDVAINAGGYTFAVGPGLERGELRAETGLAVDTLPVSLYPGAETINGVPLVQAAIRGHFDGVKVTLQRAYMVTAGDTAAGLVTEFIGRVSVAEPSSTEVRLTLRSGLDRLNALLPSRLMMAQCPYSLGSAACGVNLASFTHARTAAAGSTPAVVVLSSASTNAVAGGRLTFTSGALAGVSRAIRIVNGASVTLTVPLPAAPAAGDACEVVRGCNKNRTVCRDVFGNLARFGGFPDTPKPETT